MKKIKSLTMLGFFSFSFCLSSLFAGFVCFSFFSLFPLTATAQSTQTVRQTTPAIPVNPKTTNPITGQPLVNNSKTTINLSSPSNALNNSVNSNLNSNANAQTFSSPLTLTPQQTERLSLLFKNDRIDNTSQAAIKAVIPNSPQQIEALKQLYNQGDIASQPEPIPNSQLRYTVRTINLMRNPIPPMLHLVVNYASNISFMGQNGKPWPIAGIVPGNKDAIEVDESVKKDPYNSTVTVKTPWVSTNITYYLQGRVKPIVLFIHTAADTSQGLDSSVNITLNGIAPGTSPLAIKNVGVVSDALLNAVNNAPGSQWQTVALDSENLPVGLQMWTSPDHQRAIVRISSGQLISPEWASEASNPDNTVTAYSFNYVPLMLLANSNDGQSFQVSIKQAMQTLAGQESNQGDDANSNTANVKNVSDIEKAAMMRISHE